MAMAMKLNLSKFLQAPPNVFIFKHAPLFFSLRYLRLLGKLYYIANKKERKLIERNIEDVFGNKGLSGELVEKTFEGIFNHYNEKLLMAYRNMNILKKEIGRMLDFSGMDILEKAYAEGGVVLVTGHFGAVEFLPLALHLKNIPVSIIMCFQSEQLRQSLAERASQGNVELIDGHSPDVFHKAIEAIRRGRVLLTECDEVDVWKTKNGKTMDAFGGRILIDKSVEVLCRRTGAKALASFMVRTEKGYRLSIVPIDESGAREIDLATSILKVFEDFVMKFPDQWYQWKKFHKMRPEVG
jgi:Kdo2-lipid IVA lauroyltransferase/acyltransferase